MRFKADSAKIKYLLETIDTYNQTPSEGTTRVMFTREELDCRTFLKQEMKQMGLTITEDAIGNIYGILAGTDRNLAPVWTGSHIDTVPHAGMFDGMAGVVGGMEALRMIQASGIKHQRDLAVIIYTSEEPTRFGLSCLGSRALAGELPLNQTKELVDQNGLSLYTLLDEQGYDKQCYDMIKRVQGDVYSAVELHIEQNHTLDTASIPIGVVTGICAPTILSVTINGCQSHAGGTSMSDRKDAFAAAGELSVVLERLARQSDSAYLTATIGKLNIVPNAINVIPGQVMLSIDIRSIDMESKNRLRAALDIEIHRIQKERQVMILVELENDDRPLTCDKKIVGRLKALCEHAQIPYLELISGPYHDSLFVGRFAPTAMIFVPSKQGISHSKDEWTDFDDIATGTNLLAEMLLELANE